MNTSTKEQTDNLLPWERTDIDYEYRKETGHIVTFRLSEYEYECLKIFARAELNSCHRTGIKIFNQWFDSNKDNINFVKGPKEKNKKNLFRYP